MPYLFLEDKNLEKIISMGIRAAELTLRSLGAVKPRAQTYSLCLLHCYVLPRLEVTAFTGLEMKETKNTQPACVWETGIMHIFKNLKYSPRAEEYLLGFFLL